MAAKASTFCLVVVLSMVAMATATMFPQRMKPSLSKPFVQVQGSVLCITAKQTTPIKGATFSIMVKVKGLRNPIVMASKPSDKNGIIFIQVPKFIDDLIVIDAKIMLRSSPLRSCSIALNINNGINGVVVPIYSNTRHGVTFIDPFGFTNQV